MSAVRLLILAAAFVAGIAAAAGPAPGEYITEQGWGRLSIGPTARGGAPFSIESVGANFHICSLEGRIVGDTATLEGDDDGDCVVRFRSGAQGIAVEGNSACRTYCGMRAGFEGEYLRPATGCGDAERRATRDAFKRHYDAKRHAEALAALSPLLQRCARTLSWLETGEIRNDVAITQYRLGRRADCLRTLAPFEEEATLSDDEILGGYPPSDGEAWLPIVKAARFNLGLCRKPR